MNLETFFKYLEFLKVECLRHQNDKIIDEDEINQITIEINKFILKVNESKLAKEIKFEISNLDFNLKDENYNHPKFRLFDFIGGFQGKEFKKQENRKNRFKKLYNDLDSVLFKIKTLK